MPRVSVLIAARNAAATIGEAIASLRAQTFDDWEAIVVDDGSSDDTGAVAAAADARVRVVRHETARGPSAARNRAGREATGEMLCVLDADDLYKPRYMESQLAAIDASILGRRRTGAVFCDAELVPLDGGPAERWTDRVGKVDHVDIPALLRENVVFGLAMYPRHVFLELGGYDEDPQMSGEDYDLWLRMLENGYAIVVNPEVLAVYRLRGDSLSSDVAAAARGTRLMLDRALARGKLNAKERRIARRRRRLFEVVERRAQIADASGPARAVALARAAPLLVLAVAEHPERWRHWLRGGLRSAGARRHTG
jgi:glycosyltransferase involved in cell wall biosynthesis